MNVALQIEWEFHLDPPVTEVDEFHNLGDRLMEELLKLEACNQDAGEPTVHDSTVSTEFDRGVILVELLIMGDDPFDMTGKALAVVRAAVHAVELATPHWPTVDEMVPIEFRSGSMQAKPVDVPVPA